MKIECDSGHLDSLSIEELLPGVDKEPILLVEMVDSSSVSVYVNREQARRLAAALNRFADGGQFEESE